MTHIPSGNCVMQIQRQGEKKMCVTEAQDMGGAGIARHGVRDSDTSLRHHSIASCKTGSSLVQVATAKR